MVVKKKKVVKKKTKTIAQSSSKTSSKAKEKIESKRPLGIKIIATYYIIVSVLTVLFGFFATLFSEKVTEYAITTMSTTPDIGLLTPTMVVIIGSVMVVFGIFTLILGYNLWKMKKWARMLIIIFSALGFFSALIGLIGGKPSNLVGLIIDGFIAGYLIFSKEVKAIFK